MSDKPALHIAIEKDCLEEVLRLLESGIDVDQRDEHDRTGLFCARSGRMTRLLLEKGARVNSRCRDENSALLLAARDDQIEIASILIECGADVNARNFWDDTALHFAKTDLMAKLLIRNGASVNARGYHRLTPLLKAADFLSLRSLVLNYGRLDVRKWRPTIEMVRVLLHKGANVNATDDDGHTALHLVLTNPRCRRNVCKYTNFQFQRMIDIPHIEGSCSDLTKFSMFK